MNGTCRICSQMLISPGLVDAELDARALIGRASEHLQKQHPDVLRAIAEGFIAYQVYICSDIVDVPASQAAYHAERSRIAGLLKQLIDSPHPIKLTADVDGAPAGTILDDTPRKET